MGFCLTNPNFPQATPDEGQWVWPVVQCKQKLEARKLLQGAAAFDELQERVLGGATEQISPPDRITLADVACTWLVNSRFSLAEGAELVAAVERRATAEGVQPLARFPQVDVDLLRLNERQRQALAELIDVLTETSGVKLAKATKVLALKRPNLVPMLDLVVRLMLGGNKLATRELLERFARGADDCRRRNEDICGAMSPVRVTEKLLWFDGLFPYAGEEEATGTAHFLSQSRGWRVVYWPMSSPSPADRDVRTGGVKRRPEVEKVSTDPLDGCIFRPEHTESTSASVQYSDLRPKDQDELRRELERAGYTSMRSLPGG